MKKRFLSLALSLALCLGLMVPAVSVQAADYIAANHTASNGCPYYIMVNRKMNTVTIYGLDEKGYYTVPVRAMICSTGRPGHQTPLGTYAATSVRHRWCYMVDGTYGQYSTQFYNQCLFHSVCYSKANPAALLADEYNALGEAASLGCVRLQTADAKWIYDNCDPGTIVTIYDGDSPGPLGKPSTAVDCLSPEKNNGWDPTDPDRQNPWYGSIVLDISIPETLSLETGSSQAVALTRTPSAAAMPNTVWTSSNPAAATVDGAGTVTAVSPGTAVVTCACGGLIARCNVTVSSSPLPFADVWPGVWYYEGVRYAYEHNIFAGSSTNSFEPELPLSLAMVLQVLYRLSGTQVVTPSDTGAWYETALYWAQENGIIDGLYSSAFDPNRSLTRQEFAVLLYRFDALYLGLIPDAFPPLDSFADSDTIFLFARDAMSWAVGRKLLQGDNQNALCPTDPVTRAQAAVIFHRYISGE